MNLLKKKNKTVEHIYLDLEFKINKQKNLVK